MCDEHERVVRRYFTQIYGERHLDLLPEFIDDPTYRHKAGEVRALSMSDTRERLKSFLSECESCEIVPAKLVCAGEFVTALWQGRSRRHNSDEFETSGIEVFRFRNGKIVEIWNSRESGGHWRPSPLD